jgi:hypothetical protein
VLQFEVFRLRDEQLENDDVVAWGIFPVLGSNGESTRAT